MSATGTYKYDAKLGRVVRVSEEIPSRPAKPSAPVCGGCCAHCPHEH